MVPSHSDPGYDRSFLARGPITVGADLGHFRLARLPTPEQNERHECRDPGKSNDQQRNGPTNGPFRWGKVTPCRVIPIHKGLLQRYRRVSLRPSEENESKEDESMLKTHQDHSPERVIRENESRNEHHRESRESVF